MQMHIVVLVRDVQYIICVSVYIMLLSFLSRSFAYMLIMVIIICTYLSHC